MNGQVWGTTWYRFRATFRRRSGGYLTVIVLIGLLGGLAMGAIAGARRTQSSFSTYLASTNSSNLEVDVYPHSAAPPPSNSPYYRRLETEFARLPDVKRVASYDAGIFATPLDKDGAPHTPAALNDGDVDTIGSVNGEYFDQDRVAVTQGRLANPGRANEFVASAEATQLLGWHVGEVVPLGFYTYQQVTATPGFGTAKVRPYLRISATLTGIVVFQSEVVSDDVDRFPTNVLFTPALTKRIAHAAYYPIFDLRLDQPSDVTAVEQRIIRLLPRDTTYNVHLTSVVEGEVQRAIKPEGIALGVFGTIAGLAALLIAGQAIGRGLQINGEDLEVLRALGAAPQTAIADGLLGVFGAVLVGSLFAAGVAVGLSPLAPIGPVRQVDPSPGFAFDWAVLTAGLAVLILGLGALTLALSYWGSPHRRAARRRGRPTERASSIAGVAARAGVPATGVTGIRFALERGHGRTAVPVRSALFGAVLAVVVVVATVTFASGLNTLVSHPRLYGWNWNYAIDEVGGGNIPPRTEALLTHDRDVAGWAGFNFASVIFDGQTVPVLVGSARAAVSPPILSGHAVEANNQIVVGAATLAQLHKKLGDTIIATFGTPKDAPLYIPPTPLVIVGTATLPAIGEPGTLHTSMGTGALISKGIEPAAFRKALESPDPNLDGPYYELAVRLRSGVNPAAGLASLQRIAKTTTKFMNADPNGGGTFVVLPVQRPAEIVNYQSSGATPAVLAAAVAGGAVAGLGLTLVASVRRRRRDLALLKTLGFTQRQLAATIAWQASVAAVIGIVVGVPLGIALGRWLWVLFAHQIYAVSDPTVPVSQVVLIAVGALALTNLIAALPGRLAARTPTALLLRTE